MVEVLKCPSCGDATLEMTESGDLVCASCGAGFVLAPSQIDLLPCPQCGFHNQPQSSSCSECGAELTKYCPQCGARLDLQMHFCDQCGASYEGVSSPDGRCQWCGFENAKEARLCDKCGAHLITTCPSCEAEMKAGLDFCRACGLDYGTLLESEEV
jgi:predicted amidophosphoribosyltransferase